MSLQRPIPLLLATCIAFSARADGGASDEDAQQSPEYRKAVAAIKEGRHAEAIALLETFIGRNGKDANGHNWLGFAHRKLGNLDRAFVHYRRALVLDPQHRGVHEYIGEAYLMTGKPEQAEQHLRRLGEICGAPGCEEYEDLKKAIAAYRAAPKAAQGR